MIITDNNEIIQCIMFYLRTEYKQSSMTKRKKAEKYEKLVDRYDLSK
jgi:hypothetical protein